MAISARRLVIGALCIGVVSLASVLANVTASATSSSGSTPWPVTYNSIADAQKLHDAFEGWGTDESKVIEVLGNRNRNQRLQIAVEYKKLFDKELIDELKSELTGKFEDISVALVTPLIDFYCRSLHDALHRVGTRESALVDTLCTANNYWVNKITKNYKTMFGTELEDDIRADTSGLFQHLLISICQAKRDENSLANLQQAKADARALFDAGEGNIETTNELPFITIMTSRSMAHIRKIAKEYESISNKTFIQAIKDEFVGESESALKAILRTAENTPLYFAKRLKDSMYGPGTRDTDLIRIVVTRLEVDMGYIKSEYLIKYNVTLISDIKDDVSGDYAIMLTSLIDRQFL